MSTSHLVESNRDIMCRAVCPMDSRIVTVTARDRPQHRSPRLDRGAVRCGELYILQPYLPRSSSASASAGVEKRKRERAGWASSASILGPIASRMSGRVRMAKAR
jgi:hypothetical protein